MTDIVIPLSGESPVDNLELRLALRSIARYARNLGTIHIVTDKDPEWLSDMHIINCADTYTDNKDANLIQKVIKAAENPKVSEHFIFWSDDQLLTDYLDLDDAPVVVNPRGKEIFEEGHSAEGTIAQTGKWYNRMVHTMRYTNEHYGFPMQFNYDSHCPQPYTKSKVLEIFKEVPYWEQPGFCINTLYFGAQKDIPVVMQPDVKVTFERPEVAIPKEMKLYVGHNDAGFQNGVSLFLLGMFFEPCRYEGEV